jgi:hypothetical protein
MAITGQGQTKTVIGVTGTYVIVGGRDGSHGDARGQMKVGGDVLRRDVVAGGTIAQLPGLIIAPGIDMRSSGHRQAMVIAGSDTCHCLAGQSATGLRCEVHGKRIVVGMTTKEPIRPFFTPDEEVTVMAQSQGVGATHTHGRQSVAGKW